MSDALEEYRAGLWPQPLRARRADRAARRMGIEIEFAGLKLEEIAAVVRDVLGGELEPVSTYETMLRGARLGDFVGDFGIELDFAYLKNLGRERGAVDFEVDEPENLAEEVLALLARQVVPFEVVSPPIPLEEIWRLDTVIAELRRAGAKGTRQAPLYAFGLHLNPELPDLEAATITAYLQAFLVLSEWLLERCNVDLSRRVTPYIDPFPRDYFKQVLAENYSPGCGQLIDDYLLHNPTRNRALDMLPLFAHLDENRVRAVVDDDRIKPRPTFHYRLPNCQIDEPDWGLIRPWRDWLQIEALAADPSRLGAACQSWRKQKGGLTGGLLTDWKQASTEFLLPELL